ncbi:MAG: TolC family protein [Bacteroidota bacterium]
MKTAWSILIFVCLSSTIWGQSPRTLSLEEAEERMRSEHPELKLASLNREQVKAGQGSSWQVDPLQLHYQRGQINTLSQDNYLGISQDLGRPWLAWAERNTWQDRYELAQLKEASLERELRYRLRESWYQWQAIHAQIGLIREQVSSLREVQQVVDIRVEAGAENQVSSLQVALKLRELLEQELALNIELEKASLFFQKALGVEEMAIPQALPQRALLLSVDTSLYALANHPLLAEFGAESRLAQSRNKSQKAKYSPGFQIGYFRQSIDAQGGFDGLSLGLAVPLIFKAERSQQQMVALEGNKTEIKNQWQRQQIRQEITNLNNRAQSIQRQIEALEQESLPLAQQLRETSLLQYRQGATSYLLVQQAIQAELDVRKRYLKAIAHWNETINRLNYWLDV